MSPFSPRSPTALAARFNLTTSNRNGRAIASSTSSTSSWRSRSTSRRDESPAPRRIRWPRSSTASTQLEFDAAEMEISAVRVGGEAHSFDHSDDKLRIALRARAERGRRGRSRDRLFRAAAPRALLRRPRRRLSGQAAGGVDAGRGRGFALLVSLLRLSERSRDQRGHRDGAGNIHRGFQWRAAVEHRQSRRAYAHLSLASRCSAFVVPDEPRGGRVRRDSRTRRQHSGHLLRARGTRGRRAPRIRQHAAHDPVLRDA